MFLSKHHFIFIGLFLSSALLNAQELFPINEPASTIPKGVIGIRAATHFHYKKAGHREMIRIMYGLTPKITTMLTTLYSNFHTKEFPEDLNSYYRIYHNHNASQINYPYSFEGLHLLTKWRFLSFDHKNEHLRFALLNELAYSNSTHIDGFPSLMGDNSGGSLGLITTKLYKKLSVSITSLYTYFLSHYEPETTEKIKFKAGNSVDINLSIGYLLWPRKYKSYKDLNVNLYIEVLDKYYSGTNISRNNIYINTDQFQYLKGGNIIYICPGIQFIINSKTRIDFVTQESLYHSNNIKQYSMMRLNLQRYLF